ncbi:MAG: DEAD/DEAH box helicase, partial [Desulfurococcaceae archaeon]
MNVSELVERGLPKAYVEILQERGVEELNPIQVRAVELGLLGDANMVVSSPTASGKTLVAEMALVKTAVNRGIGVYLTPLRALASEKYGEFGALWKLGLSIGITTGDYDQPAEHLGEHDIIVATYERFDSLMRLKPTWLNRVKLVVVDEMHNVSDPERGPIIEMIIARSLKQGIRVLGLSATIGNPADLAKWINGQAVVSDWRPVKLVEGVYNKRKSEVVFSSGSREEVPEESSDSIINLVLHNLENSYQTLVFVHNRKRVEELASETANILGYTSSRELSSLIDELEEAPTRLEKVHLRNLMLCGVGFHHAGLSHVSRRTVEEAFRKRLLRVIYATPTLAAGVNLPARRVIVSIKRYDPTRGRKVNISVSEYKQMVGRAGRPKYDEIGESIIVDASSVSEGFTYIDSRPEPVQGKLFNERSLRIHILSALTSLEAGDIDSLVDLLGRTLSAQLNAGFELNKRIDELVEFLRELGMVARSGPSARPTKLGRITTFSYLDPITVSAFFKYRPERYRDIYILHLVALTPDFMRSSAYIPGRVLANYEELAEAYSSSGLIIPPTTE